MKQDMYRKLESTMVRYRDLIAVPVMDTGEPFIRISQDIIPNGYISPLTDMAELLGADVIVRKSVVDKLCKAQNILRSVSPTLSLYVTYGYRSLEVQSKRFSNKLSEVATEGLFDDPVNLYEKVHRFIAVPTVAGHPTGGAVDITLKNISTGKFINFGSSQYDYSTKDCYVFAPMNKTIRNNRILLRQVMIQAGFAPFDGEWWHFSYGDREWAYYYKKPNTLYTQRSVSQVISKLVQCEL